MSFEQFLTEAAEPPYETVNTDQLNILRQEIDRSALRVELNKTYIDKSDLNINLFNNDYYIGGMRLDNDDNVIIKVAIIVEVTEDDGYLYYKIANIVYDINQNKIIKIIENDKIRDENWKTVQGEILKTAIKL